MRHIAFSIMGSVLVAAIVLAGFGIYGLIFPGGRNPSENALLIERESGAKFLYLQGKLHPVLNYTSARLILGQAKPPVRTMAARSLRDVPRGQPVGIPGAPDTLPDRKALLGLPWSVCSARKSATSIDMATHVFVGRVPDGGTALADRGLLVDGGEAGVFLVWQEHRLRVRDNTAITALEWAGVEPVGVGEAFLNAVPPGPDLAPVAVPGAGGPAQRQIAGAPAIVGQLFRAGSQHYVLLPDGLSPIGEVMTRLILAGGTVTATDISARDAGDALTEAKYEPPGFPATIPALYSDARPGMACAAYRGAGERAEPQINVEVHAQPAGTFADAGQTPPVPQGSDGVVTADRVILPGGRAALVNALQEAGGISLYLVVDQGIKYPVPRAQADKVRSSLGYEGVQPIPVPASILALVPTAAALDPEAATRFVPNPTVAPAQG